MALSFTVLRNRDFRLLMLTRLFGLMALQAQDIIAGWQIYSLTHDPLMLGLTGLAEAVPAIACALFAGHIVDTHRPHFVYAACIGALALNAVALLFIAGGVIAVPGGIIPWIFASIFVSGLARSFIFPASFALLSTVVPRSQITAASAWLSSGFQFATIVGPAIAGIVYGGYGALIAWLMPAALLIITFLCMIAMSKETRQKKSAEQREPFLKSIKSGWRFLVKTPPLLATMALDMFAILFGGAVAMLPAYADQILHVGSEGLGILRAAPAVGAIISALILSLWPMKDIRASSLLWINVVFGICIIVFGISTSFWLSLIMLGISGAVDSISVVVRSTLLQLLTPDNMRGRVSSVGSMFIISSNEIGAFESGVAAKLFGLVPSVVIGGIGTLLVVTATAVFSPSLRKTVVKAD